MSRVYLIRRPTGFTHTAHVRTVGELVDVLACHGLPYDTMAVYVLWQKLSGVPPWLRYSAEFIWQANP